MTKILASAVVLLLAMPRPAAAHRLDEYLQAARVSLAHDRIVLELDLTPGSSIAAAIVTLLDRDADGSISPVEARAYGLDVLSGVSLELDGRPVALTLTRVEVPPIEEMHDGSGVIQVRASGGIDASRATRRLLYFRNDHRPDGSVYLANALLPEGREVTVLSQRRDPRQQQIHVEYAIGSRWPGQVLSVVLAVFVLTLPIVLRRSSSPVVRAGDIRATAVHFPPMIGSNSFSSRATPSRHWS
jgi:hypothetical protein